MAGPPAKAGSFPVEYGNLPSDAGASRVKPLPGSTCTVSPDAPCQALPGLPHTVPSPDIGRRMVARP